MPTRRFGRTEFSMPVFSCGGMRYQHAWQDKNREEIPSDSQANVEACIKRAIELGIRHIETARGYGTSELQLAPALKKYPRDAILVQTKVGPRAEGAEFTETVHKSLGLLEVDYVDLLAVHGINTREILDQCMAPGGTLSAAIKLKKEGKCRAVGFSTHGPMDAIVAAIETDVFDYVNLHWYFVNEINWPAIEAATRHDMGVFIISPNDKGGKLYEPTPRMIELCAPLTPMQFNDLYCLSRSNVHTLSLGASRPSDFDEHVAGLKWYENRNEITREIAMRIHQAMGDALGRDWSTRWMQGLPEWKQVPGHINIWEIVRLWNYATALGMESFAKMRYNLLGQGDHWFPGKNAGEFDERAILECLSGYPFADRIPALLRDAHRRFHEAPKKRLSESE
ncbi:MAG TPA: aldo/keto reductase [Kiritimatiellia bacterium]|nr:aldo/keto reductase [Kiritimatiellia bacterium]